TAQVDADLVAKRRLFAPVGPGLKQIREGADGKIYVLASPSPGLVVYSPEARRLLTMREASGLSAAALAEAKASGDVLVEFGEDCDVDSEGTIYVADRAANKIQVYSKEGRHLRTIAVAAPIAVAALPEAGAMRREIQRQERRGDTPRFKQVMTAMSVEKESGEVWIAIGNMLLRFDKEGNRRATFRLYTPDNARLDAVAMVVEKDK